MLVIIYRQQPAVCPPHKRDPPQTSLSPILRSVGNSRFAPASHLTRTRRQGACQPGFHFPARDAQVVTLIITVADDFVDGFDGLEQGTILHFHCFPSFTASLAPLLASKLTLEAQRQQRKRFLLSPNRAARFAGRDVPIARCYLDWRLLGLPY